MRPRWQFILRGVLAFLGGVLMALVLLYLISLIIFIARQSGAAFVPAFGLKGVWAFLRALPWLLIVFSLVFIVLLEVLVRHYPFAYKRPLAYSACGIIVLVVAGGFIVAGTSLHRMLSDEQGDQRVPRMTQKFYRFFGQYPLREIRRGLIVSTTTSGFILREGGRTSSPTVILVGPRTQTQSVDGLRIGEAVVVFGPNASDSVQAIGIQEIGDDE